MLWADTAVGSVYRHMGIDLLRTSMLLIARRMGSMCIVVSSETMILELFLKPAMQRSVIHNWWRLQCPIDVVYAVATACAG